MNIKEALMDKNAKVTGIDNGVGQFAAEASVEVDDLVSLI